MAGPRILLLIPNLGHGGAQQVFYKQRQFLSGKFDVVACAFNFDGAFPGDAMSGIVSLGIPAGKNFLNKFTMLFHRVRAVKKLKRDHRIDVTISHLEGADYVNILSAGHDRTICWIHGTKRSDRDISGVTGWIRRNFLMPFLYKKCHRLVTVSEEIRSELMKEFRIPGDRITTIYNGVDLQDIHTKSKEPIAAQMESLFNHKKVLITHCRLAGQKNVSALLRIFKQVKMEVDVALVILGDGELRESLLNESNALGLRTYDAWSSRPPGDMYDVFFPGYVTNPFPILSKATLYLMTSSWEGFPLSLCEAMACHVPVLVADCPTGPKELLGAMGGPHPAQEPVFTERGVLMPLPDPRRWDLWVRTIQDLLGDEVSRKRLATGGFTHIQSLDMKTLTGRWLEIVQEGQP